MPRPSKIDRLPPEIKEAIGELRRAGRTIDEILGHLHELGAVDVKRSGLGDYVKKLDEVGAEMRRDRAIADALVGRFGAEPDDKLFRLNVELMQGMIMKLNLAVRSGDTAALEPQDLMFLATALGKIASASKTDSDRVDRIEARMSAKLKRDAEGAIDKIAGDVATAGGRTDPQEVLRRIRQDIYGIFER